MPLALPALALALITAPARAEGAGPSDPLPVEPVPPGAPTGPADTAGDSLGAPRRTAPMEVNLRYRSLTIPDSVMDIWYFDEDDPGAYSFKRPSVRAYVVGVEYVVKPKPVNWILYGEYMGNRINEGYWDDVEDGIIDHDDGEWIRPDGLGAFIFGANAAGEVDVTDPEKDVWLSLLFGGGLGIVFMKGELTEWNPGGDPANTEPDCLSEASAYDRYKDCADDGAKRIPGVLPMVDISISARVNFGERANLRLEGGVHDLLYFGGAVGAVF